MTTLLNLSFGLLCSLSLGAPRIGPGPLAVGTQAPAFEVDDVDGKHLNLETMLTHGPVVLVFFPAANSPSCTKELQTFVARADELKTHGAQVVAISSDKANVLQAFRDDLKANFSFVADTKALIAGRYQARMPIIPQSRRRTYVIDRAQKVVLAAEEDDAISLKGVMEAISALPH